MKRINFVLFLTVLLSYSYKVGSQTNNIRINQCGYYPASTKIALVVWTKASTFEVLKAADSSFVLSGNLTDNLYYTDAADSLKQADFSALTAEGKYLIHIPGEGYSYAFQISKNAYRELAYASLRSFYYQRSSFAIDSKYGGLWSRVSGHPDNSCIFHSSTGRSGKAPSPGGWYDAGDYGKYVINAGVTVGNMLQLYECFSWYYPDSSASIPESGNGLNDLLDEVKYELNWLRTMQDADGGVFHKLTTLQFSGFVMPNADKADRYFIGKGTCATLDFAAMMAMAGRIYAKTDSVWAAQCIEMAEKAWIWAVAHPAVYFKNPSDVGTGEYGDGNSADEFIWAAAELLTTTGKDVYNSYLLSKKSSLNYDLPGWPNVAGLGIQTLAMIPNKFDSALNVLMKKSIVTHADGIINDIRKHPGRLANIGYYWGCNGSHSEAGICLIYAYLFTKDSKYVAAAGEVADYLMGRNPMAQSFFSYYGNKTMMNPHHRPSASDNIAMPIPGFLSGGTNNGKDDKLSYPYIPKAKSYLDITDSYASNEVCINWNGPATYLLAALDAILGDSAQYLYVPITEVNNHPVTGLSKPTPNLKVSQTDSVTIVSSATDADGIAKVEFYIDNKFVGTDDTKPYSIKVFGLNVGKHTATAVAFDAFNFATEKAVQFEITKPVIVENQSIKKMQLLISPNPSNGITKLSFLPAISGTVTVNCYDVAGKLITADELTVIENKFVEKEIDIRHLAANGMFTFTVAHDGTSLNAVRFIKTK